MLAQKLADRAEAGSRRSVAVGERSADTVSRSSPATTALLLNQQAHLGLAGPTRLAGQLAAERKVVVAKLVDEGLEAAEVQAVQLLLGGAQGRDAGAAIALADKRRHLLPQSTVGDAVVANPRTRYERGRDPASRPGGGLAPGLPGAGGNGGGTAGWRPQRPTTTQPTTTRPTTTRPMTTRRR